MNVLVIKEGNPVQFFWDLREEEWKGKILWSGDWEVMMRLGLRIRLAAVTSDRRSMGVLARHVCLFCDSLSAE